MDLHVFLVEDSERHWVAAADEEDAMRVYREIINCDPEEDMDPPEVTRLDDAEDLRINDDGVSRTKPCGEWVKEGRGLVASTLY